MTNKQQQELVAWQVESEKSLVASAYLSPKVAVQDAAWLEGGDFIDKVLGDYWEKIKKGADTVESAIELGIAEEMLGPYDIHGFAVGEVIQPKFR